jgi:transmembrane sensor
MANDRFIELITKELCDQLTETEREELSVLLQGKEEYRDQRDLFREYWVSDRGEYGANAAMFEKVIDKIKAAEAGGGKMEDAEPGSKELEDAKMEEEMHGLMERERAGKKMGKRIRFSMGAWFSAAAVILLVISFVIYHYLPHNEIATLYWLKKTTQPAKKSVLTFSDGTVVTLNSATTLSYPENFNDSLREVYLDGEAYFDVAKDPQRPFIIHTHKMNIRVLGTSFNVKSYQHELLSEAALVKGSIEVTLNDRPSDRIILTPNEKLVVQNYTAVKAKVNTIPTQKQDSIDKGTRYSLTYLTHYPNVDKTVIETSWVENKLVFSDKDFVGLASQLERWFGVHIEFTNEKVKEYRFGGLFEKESLPEVLNALQMTESFEYKISDSIVYIY